MINPPGSRDEPFLAIYERRRTVIQALRSRTEQVESAVYASSTSIEIVEGPGTLNSLRQFQKAERSM